MKVVVRFDGNSLRCISAFKDDKEIAQIAFDNGAGLSSFGPQVLSDCTFMTRALYIKPEMLGSAPPQVKNSREMVTAAIRSYPRLYNMPQMS